METQNLPKLVKQSATYKLVVPEKVEEKIRYLIRKFPATEWSGVLFYTHTGGFETNDLVITCEDIFPMDLGSSGYTEFNMTSDVSNYIANNIELFDCETGLVHSHHSMGAFLSSTDLSTVQKEGNDTNCFVSLVVDTRGTYVAAITRKVISLKKIVTETSSYNFFGEGSKIIGDNNITEEIATEEIQYFMLDVDRHTVDNSLDYLDKRFEEIEAKKKKVYTDIKYTHSESSNEDFSSWLDNRRPLYSKQGSLFDDEGIIQDVKHVSSSWIPNKDLIHKAVCKLVTCSLIIATDKLDLRQWITKFMDKTYQRIFEEPTAFDEWAEFAVPFLVWHFEDKSAPDTVMDNTYFDAISMAMIDELNSVGDRTSPYISKYINELQAMIN